MAAFIMAAAILALAPRATQAQPVPGGREAIVRAFTDRYYAAMSAAPDKAIAFLGGAAAGTVRFYGQRVAHDTFVGSEQAYLQRWPVRRFGVRPESVAVACAYPSAECAATGTVDYQLGSAARSAAAAGAEKFTLRVEVLGDEVKILEVSSAAITQQNDAAPK